MILIHTQTNSGLDDLSSSQCIALLKMLAAGGRTVICSIHTPSAKIFEMLDAVYVLAEGQCIYQGRGANIVPYMEYLGLHCLRSRAHIYFVYQISVRIQARVDMHNTIPVRLFAISFPHDNSFIKRFPDLGKKMVTLLDPLLLHMIGIRTFRSIQYSSNGIHTTDSSF